MPAATRFWRTFHSRSTSSQASFTRIYGIALGAIRVESAIPEKWRRLADPKSTWMVTVYQADPGRPPVNTTTSE
jgi:hypothetical protein